MNISDQIVDNLTEKIVGLLNDPPPPPPSADEKIAALRADLDSMTKLYSRADDKVADLNRKIQNVEDHIKDVYFMNGVIDEDLRAVAELLDISLTKQITGSGTVTFEFTADVPLDFDGDLDLSVYFETNNIDVNIFEPDNVSCEWEVEDDL
jgi:hypothetical protein